jgi:predicted nucleotide-binding protein
MTKRPYPPLKLLMRIAEATQKINERITKGKEIKEIQIGNEHALERARKEYYKWSDYNHELMRRMFTSEEIADEYSGFGFAVGRTGMTLYEEIEDFHSDIDTKIYRLESVRDRLELIPLDDSITVEVVVLKKIKKKQSNARIFIVHGHDEAARELVARFLERIELEPIILHEQPNKGSTIIEKLEENADVSFAVVLLTPDDEGRKKGDSALRDRARQNVLLELGYFIGRLGRKHVCALHKGSVEIPTDYLGVLFLPFDNSGGWQLKLAKELKAAGFSIDMNKAVE